MTKHHDAILYFVSLFVTLLLFGFVYLLLAVSAGGAGQDALFSITRTDAHRIQMEAMGDTIELDYTALEKPGQLRREYAPLLTPRLILTAEYIAGYTAHWGRVLHDAAEEYLFTKEAYGPDALPAQSQQEPSALQ